MLKFITLTTLLFSALNSFSQILIINEVSQGITGNMEYVELVVVDSTISYDCSSSVPPSLDIRGWIFDDNSGYHGAGGIASGAIRFSYNPIWAAVPLGTIILIYNDAEVDPSIPASDISMADGNCTIIAPISNINLFESNATTPGAGACSYPAVGWTAGGNWNNTLLANAADCARIVNLLGCEVFSVCWGTDNLNTMIYFAGNAGNTVYYFNDTDPANQLNWSSGCTDNEVILDANICGSNDQTPGIPNNAANAAYISQFNNGCVTITPIVASAIVDNNEICGCDGQATASGAGSIPGYTYEWQDAAFIPIGQTSATASGLCAGTYNVVVTSSIGCSDVSTVVISPGLSIPTVVDPADQVLCANTATTAVTFTGNSGSTVYNWTNNNTSIGLGASGAGNIASFTAINAGAAAVVATITVTPTLGTCIGTSQTFTITVTPLNTVAAGTSQTVCINSAITPITLATTGSTGSTVTGLPAGVTGSWAANVVTISGTPTASGPFTYTVTTTGGCPPATTTGTITVTPLNTVTAGTSQTVCINSAITPITLATTGATGATFSVLPAGVTGSWAGNVATISGTPAASGTFNYTVTTTGGCPPATTTGTITVTPLNTIAGGTSQTVCMNSPITAISLATTGATGATFGVLPPGVTGSWAGNVVTISGTPTLGGTYNYTVTTTGGCPPATTTGTITVLDAPVISATGISPTSCVLFDGTINVLLSSGPSSLGTLSWTGVSSGSVGPQDISILNPDIIGLGAGTYNVTFTDANGCFSNTVAVNLVLPGAPTATITGTSGSYCTGNPSGLDVTIVLTGSGGPWNFTYTDGVIPVSVTNHLTSTYTIVAATAGTYTLSLVTEAGCNGITSGTAIITVTPLNTIAAGTSQTVCVNSAITPITLATTGATGATFSGLPAGLTGSWAGNIVTISGTPTIPGPINYTVTTTGGCPPAIATGTITVTPLNTIAAGTSQTVCVNSVITTITLATTGATGATFSGLPAGVTGSWAGDVVTISGAPTASGTFNYTVTTTGGCPPATTTGTITVNPNNIVTSASSNPTLCVNTVMINVTFTTTGATGIGAPTGLPAGVTAAWAGNTITISGMPTVQGTFNYSIPLTGGCGVVNAVGTITVNPNNTVTAASSNPSLCINTVMVNVTFISTGATGIGAPTGLPTGVIAVWAGNTITISGTPTASGSFNYSIPLTGGCGILNAVGTITVNPDNTVTVASSNPSLCINTAMVNVTFTTTGATGIGVPTGLPAGVTAVWAGNTITVSGTPTAAGSFNYSIPLIGGCGALNAVGTISVYTTPVLNAITDLTSCGSVVLPNITGTNTMTPSYWTGINQTGTQYQPGSTYSTVGTTVLYAYDGANGCSTEVSFNVTISEIPVLTVSDPSAVCAPATIDLTIYAISSVGTINYYSDLAMTQLVPTPTSLGNGTYYVEATNIGCTDAGVINVVVNAIPNSPIAGMDATYCSSWTVVPMTAFGAGGTYTWYSDAGLSSILGTGGSLLPTDVMGSTTYYVTETLLGCEGPSSAVVITIEDCEIIVPTAFTPDGDLINDFWQILDLDEVYPNNVVMVYNRWGSLLYQSDKGAYAANPWDGTYEGNVLPVGSYYFIIDFNLKDVEPQKGIVSIIHL